MYRCPMLPLRIQRAQRPNPRAQCCYYALTKCLGAPSRVSKRVTFSVAEQPVLYVSLRLLVGMNWSASRSRYVS
jgi:hypothetical protein